MSIRRPTKTKYGITKFAGPFASVYACPCCAFTIIVKRERNPGRGFGLRTGSVAFAQMIKHVREMHPDQPRENK